MASKLIYKEKHLQTDLQTKHASSIDTYYESCLREE